MNVNDIYPSKYVKAHDLGDKLVTVTIKNAAMEDLGYGAEKEQKLVIYFERATKGLILNRTNAMIIASMYTPETDNWKGKAIILYSMRVKAFGAWHNAVRVKEQVPPRNVGAAQIPDAMQEAPPIDDDDDLLDVDVDDGLDSPRIDPDTGEITSSKPSQNRPETSQTPTTTREADSGQSPPHQRLFGQGASAFGPDWDTGARAWLVLNWTDKVERTEPRDSASQLSDTEKDLLADYIKANLKKLQDSWRKQKAALMQSTGQPETATAA